MLFTDYVQFLHDLWIIALVLEKAEFIKSLSPDNAEDSSFM